jgi:hypothetical protein
MRRWFKSGAAACVILPTLASCTVAVHFVSIDDADYKAAWSAGWTSVDAAATPWIPSNSSPGVCNIGGDKQACADTDQQVSATFGDLLAKLNGAQVPSEFATANSNIVQGITLSIQGLNERDTSLIKDDQALFTQARSDLMQAENLLRLGYSQFPAFDLPTPAPFDGRF